MRTIRVKLFKFEELSEKAQKKAISEFSDINVDHDWWNFIYADAAEIGLQINEFDIHHGYCKGELLHSLNEVCNLIITNHGENCDTYITAKLYLAEWAKLVQEHSDGIHTDIVTEEKENEFDKLADELEKQFRLSLCEDYRILLSKEYDYMTSYEAIKESIISNEYEFTQEGKFYY